MNPVVVWMILVNGAILVAIGMYLVAILDTKVTPPPERHICRYCGAPVPLDADTCPRCGGPRR